MPEDLKTVADRLFSAAASIQGTSLSRSKKTLSNYLCLLFPEIVYLCLCPVSLWAQFNNVWVEAALLRATAVAKPFIDIHHRKTIKTKTKQKTNKKGGHKWVSGVPSSCLVLSAVVMTVTQHINRPCLSSEQTRLLPSVMDKLRKHS